MRNFRAFAPLSLPERPFPMKSPVRYRIAVASAEAHLFDVRMQVDAAAPQGHLLRLPAWIPGSYMIRDFSRHIVRIEASCNGQPVLLTKLDKDSWQAAPTDGPLEVRYEVYAYDLSVRGAYLDATRGFFNPSSLCLYAEGLQHGAHEVDVRAPKASALRAWRLACALNAVKVDKAGFGRYLAKDYDALIDHPFELGDFEEVSFKACGVPHRLVLSGRHHHADLKRLARDAKQICESQIRLFGKPAPFEHYLFLLYVGGGLYGGLEHRNSTALMADRDDLPKLGDDGLSDGYLQLLGLISHEYFHNWNVKRIKPAAFVPYDLTRENHTRLLWAFEGVTSYYDDLTLLRAGLIDAPRYLGLLARTVTSVLRGSGRLKQTLEASSFDAWTKYYKQDENSPNAIVSYYAKGALAALALDLTIRRDSDGRHSLDDVMRALWLREREAGQGIGEDEWEAIARKTTGLPLAGFFEQALRSTSDLPLAELLVTQGVTLQLVAAASGADRGGVETRAAKSGARVTLGVKCAPEASGVRLMQVFDDGAAQRAGLSGGDVMVALDGLRLTDLERALAGRAAGEVVAVHAFRRDELMRFDVELQAAPEDTCYLALADAGCAWLQQQ